MTSPRITRVLAVGAVTVGFMFTGTAVAGAETSQVALDPTCLQEGADAFIADPVGVLTGAAHDPAGAIHAEVACIEDVLGL